MTTSDTLSTAHLFALPPEIEEFRASARAFAERDVAPLVEEAEHTGTFPLSLFRRAGDQGLLGLQFDMEWGGSEAGLLADMVFREEVSRVCAGIAAGLGIQGQIGTAYLARYGSDEQKARWLRPAIAGELITAWGLTEPDAGSDVRSIRTTVRPDGDGFVLNGRKTFITNGPIAGVVGVVAKQGEDRFAVFMVEASDPGYSVERTLNKLGCRSSQVGELVFDNVRLDESRRISPPEGSTIDAILDVLIRGRVLIAAAALGVAGAAFDLGLQYAKDRRAFGKPIGKFQEISMKFAEADARIAAARLLTYRAAVLCDSTDSVPIRECAQAKLIASETALWVVDQMMRVFGGMGFMAESTIERLYRDVRYFQIVEGTTEIQHRILAKAVGL
ncbi:acyl-CoA dehydrogenase [Microbacterium sp. PI-1]|uniref:acyl-CoA dehydrogenase family protein n=1 Tax=Microbacterium sp. PI-1 TaxID=2545631 RepID=UPI00103DBB35|nr:acyl-CoA dehydrogenase family protein [Microbacterium sp. PI-1]TCJ21956.1 acyl-CoA dehydrogenase [Microbacterium sp. PI-1]